MRAVVDLVRSMAMVVAVAVVVALGVVDFVKVFGRGNDD